MQTMNLSSVTSRALNGIESPVVTVEVHVSNGLPSLSIVGLPEASVKESKDRVRSALLSSGFQIPPKRITVNLAPADLPKSGGRYDLPIAIGILIATGQLDGPNIERLEFIGELALNGELRSIKGALPSLLAAHSSSRICVLPEGNQAEALLSQSASDLSANFILVRDLKEACRVVLGEQLIPPKTQLKIHHPNLDYPQDLSDISGQLQAKRVLEIAASGHHSLIMVGPPGSGKSMLASRLVTLLPALTQQEAIESATIHSITGQEIGGEHFYKRPFVNPHHTASAAALVGGGSIPKPGAISLAHNGLLFLDELPEFTRNVLEALREPLESKRVEISRVNQQVSFPANCLLVAAMNPSPSGFFPDDPLGRCQDTPDQIHRYQKKISGPLIDRIDLHLEVPAVDLSDLQGDGAVGESSAQVRDRVMEVRTLQLKRQGCLNCDLTPKELKEHVILDALSLVILDKAVNQLGISARGYHRILRIARTLADMERLADVGSQHIAEALGYRSLDRIH
ncbi:YifB family Mg chelatase-like AAA ATPase [Thiomicrorhabdus arctica]|uniref:YifB family Mg chelatase-like AAA ATPase n=1 Tax=Thiomicrorhabdus arctica TaxID=131540 RepID=UPI0003611506|nr:YifB family Mg chelatase-like AAA ATPase [Thiomicrorhabdus arctica]